MAIKVGIILLLAAVLIHVALAQEDDIREDRQIYPGGRPGYPRPGYPGYPRPGYPRPGYPGYPRPGYPRPGYPGYPRPGYPRPGYPGAGGGGYYRPRYPGGIPPAGGIHGPF